jgi:hypothetical protein
MSLAADFVSCVRASLEELRDLHLDRWTTPTTFVNFNYVPERHGCYL